MFDILETFTFNRGFDSSKQPIDTSLAGAFTDGSFNAMCIDNGRNVPFGGLLTKGANTGSKILSTLGNTWGGIKDISVSNKTFTDANVNVTNDTITITAHGYTTGMSFTLTTTGVLPGGLSLATTYYVIISDANTIKAATSFTNALAGTAINITSASGGGTHTVNVTSATVAASGNIIQDIGNSVWGIGSGQPHKEGTDFSNFLLSSLLKVLIQVNGSYTDPSSGPYTAGLPQPSAPDVIVKTTPSSGFTGLINGAVSYKIARIRLSTGARSIASNTSVVTVPVRKTNVITFPAASTGQTHWHLFATQHTFGGTGIHYQVSYNGVLDIPESTIAASSVDGVSRSIEFEYRDGDLQATEAYLDDYPPPAGTHVARVESSMVVFGCYSDSASSPSSTNAGTCAAVSLPNFPESYRPQHILFFPEPIVTVLSRPIDSFSYVLCRNSIHAVQFVGYRDELPSCTITTVSPEVGVVNPQNVTQAYGRLFFWHEKSGIVAMAEDGSLDYEFGAPIRKYTKNWDTTTVVGFDPVTRSINVSNGSIMFLFCFQGGTWSAPCYLSDIATGTIESSVTTRGEQVVSLNNAGTRTAYSVNQGAAISTLPVMYASNISQCGTKRGKNVYELLVSGEFPLAGTLYIGVHSNFRSRVFRDVGTTNASNQVTSATAAFTATTDVLKEVFIFGANIGGGIDFLAARIASVLNSTTITIQNLDGTGLTASATLSNCTMILASQVFTQAVTAAGYQNTYSVYPEIVDARQVSVSTYFISNLQTGQIFDIQVSGRVSVQKELNL